MKKIKYIYNTHTLRYERYMESWQRKAWRLLSVLSAALVFAALSVALAYRYFDSPKEKQLRYEIAGLKDNYDLLNEKLEQMNAVESQLEERDNTVYRVIFEANPISDNVRHMGYGGSNRYQDLDKYDNGDLIKNTAQKLDMLRRRMFVQSKSYDELYKLAKEKEKMLACIPAIQPISNKDLTRIASGFGYRIDPILKIPLSHPGIDFVAAPGTPIYATGDGVVSDVNGLLGGYGYYVVIDHGFSYHTLYGHMSRVHTRVGQKVSRGDVIGYVGSTGRSTGPHLHYEVWKNGARIDPINFFFNDVNADQYEKLIELAKEKKQSFD